MTDSQAFVLERKRIKGTFSESLELQEFPFDVQDLSVVISSELGSDVIDIVEDDTTLSAVNVLCFVDATEWDIYDLVYSEQQHVNKETPEVQHRNPSLAVKTVAQRRSGFFVYNIITITILITSLAFTTFCVDVELVENRLHLSLILSLTGVTFKLVTFHLLPKIPYITRLVLICSLSFTTFSVDINLVQNRLQLSFIITLTAVTFKHVCNQMIPRIHYLTYLDRLILGGLVFTWLTCIWHAVVAQIQDINNKKVYDFWAFISFIIIYVLFHLIFYIMLHIKRSIRAKSVALLQNAYQIKATRLMGQHWKTRRDVQRASITKHNRTSMADKLQLAD